MNIEKQSTKFITPFVPTPPTLRPYKTSFIDELAPSMDVGVVLFFSTNNNQNPKCVTKLEQSLEKTLTRFYPLAGRYIHKTYTVDCNDEGVEFTCAKVNIKLQDILAATKANVKHVDEFTPSKIGANTLLAIQATMFECGGMALGVTAAHKIVDASTLCTFLTEWAAVNRDGLNDIEVFTGSGFNSSLLFPGRCFQPTPVQHISDDDISSKYTKKLYSFNESAISKMKAVSTTHRHWSKVQLVSAIIWKALIGVDRANNNPRESILLQPVNLREKTASLIPKDSCGNLWGLCVTEAGTIETTEELVDHLTDNVKKTITNFSKVNHNSEEGQLMVLSSILLPNIQESTNVITLTSWCKFPFYEIDFGFGKPTWIAPGRMFVNNALCLMDEARGNGIDAHVLLELKDVLYFEEALRLQVNSFVA